MYVFSADYQPGSMSVSAAFEAGVDNDAQAVAFSEALYDACVSIYAGVRTFSGWRLIKTQIQQEVATGS